MRAAFRTPGFGRLFAGLAASMFGDSLMLIVLSMWVKTLTGSNGAAGLTFLWMTAPALLAPAFGYVVDRVPRTTFLVLANVGSALAVLSLLLVHDAGDVWIVYAVAFCYGISFVVVPAALNGLLKDFSGRARSRSWVVERSRSRTR
jgi:MFS family permease